MAANTIVIGSKFKPFSYAEMLQPVQAATEAHQAVEEQYADLATKASVWEQMANEQSDPYAYSLYNAYSKDLAAQAEELAKNGLSPGSRQNMNKMRSRYSKEIVPIEQAYTRRKELLDEQRKALSQDNTLMFNTDASTLSLDDLIKNPSLSYQSYSGALISKQVGTAASNLAKEMREDPRKWKGILQGQYFETRMKQGYSPEEIILSAANDPSAPQELKRIVEDAITSSGVRNWGNQAIIDRAYQFAHQGLWNAIGETKYQTLQNQEYLDPIKRAKLNAMGQDSPRLPYRAIPKTKVDASIDTSRIQSDIDFIKEVAASNGEILKQKAYKENPETRYFSPDPQGGFTMSAPTGLDGKREEYYPNVDRLKEITSRLGTTNPDQIVAALEHELKGAAVRSFNYATNLADNEPLNKVFRENTRALIDEKKSPLYEYDDGRKGDQLSKKEADKIVSEIKDEKGFMMLDPETNSLIYSYVDNGESKRVIVDPEVLDDKDRTLKSLHDKINEDKKNKDYKSLNFHVMQYMGFLDGRFNTQAKVQGKTDAKLDVPWID